MYFIIKLSKLCNLRCTYCYEYPELGNKERMPLEKLDYFFRHLASYLQFRPDIKPNFVWHGGEPLLLPHDYIQAVRDLQKQHLDPLRIAYKNILQTNLVHVTDRTLDLLQNLDIKLGVSFDVFGEQRVDIKGRDSQKRVIDNLQRLIDRDIGFGAISVLHALNVDKAINTFHFYNDLGIDYRILPYFSIQDATADQGLALSHEHIVSTLKAVALEQFGTESNIKIYPLWNYFQAAVRFLSDQETKRYTPNEREWALIININGDVYASGDSYLPEGKMGNLFEQPIADVLASPEHAQVTALREQRLETCKRCQFDLKCNQLPIAESFPSERAYDTAGNLECSIARPMIQFLVEQIQQSPDAQLLMGLYSRPVEAESGVMVPAL